MLEAKSVVVAFLTAGLLVRSAPAQEMVIDSPPPDLRPQYRVEDSDPIEDADDGSSPAGEAVARPPIRTEIDTRIEVSHLEGEDSAFTVNVVSAAGHLTDASVRAALGGELTKVSFDAGHLSADGPFRTSASVSLVRPADERTERLDDATKIQRMRRIGKALLEERGAAVLGAGPAVEYWAFEVVLSQFLGAVRYQRAVRGVLCPNSVVTVAIDNNGLVQSFGGPVLNLDAILPALARERIDAKAAQEQVRAFLTPAELAKLDLPRADAPVGEAMLTCWDSPPYVLWAVDTGALGTYFVDVVTGTVKGKRI